MDARTNRAQTSTGIRIVGVISEQAQWRADEGRLLSFDLVYRFLNFLAQVVELWQLFFEIGTLNLGRLSRLRRGKLIGFRLHIGDVSQVLFQRLLGLLLRFGHVLVLMDVV